MINQSCKSKLFSFLSDFGGNFINPFVWGVFFKPLNDSVSCSLSIEINWWLRFIFSEEFESWESLNINASDFVFSWIDLSNNDVWIVGNSLSSSFVVWDEGLAMSAPWGVELNQNLFFTVHNEILEWFSDNCFDCGIAWFWDLSGFQELLDFTCFDSFNEWGECVSGDFLAVENVFFSTWSQEENCWYVVNVDSQIFSKSVKKSMAIILVR